jgi:hypothetical protein
MPYLALLFKSVFRSVEFFAGYGNFEEAARGKPNGERV